MTRRAANQASRGWLVALAAVVWACGESGGAEYRVSVDLGPTILALASDDLDIASAAEDKVVSFGDDALPVLRRALRREDEPVRLGVVEALAQMPGDAVAGVLVQTMREDRSERVRAEAAFALRSFRAPFLEEALDAALRDPSPAVRAPAATACGAVCATPASVEVLVTIALDDPAPQAWWAARASLVRLRSHDGTVNAAIVDAAIRAAAPAKLADGEGERSARAALLLADVGDARGAERLARAVTESDDAALRQQAVLALGAVGGPSAIDVLRRAASEPSLKAFATSALEHARSRGITDATTALGRP